MVAILPQCIIIRRSIFNVKKGNSFNVVSSLGKTFVLGTSFNIFSREDKYRVACVTGKVKVISITNKQVILSPNYHAEIIKDGNIKVTKNIMPALPLSG